MALSPLRRLVFPLVVALAACGGAPEVTPQLPGPAPAGEPAPAVEPASTPVSTLVNEAIGAKIRATVETQKLAAHPLAKELADLGNWMSIFEDTEIEPMRDVERAYVSAKNAGDREAIVVVAQHALPAATIEKAMNTMVDRSGERGAWLKELHPRAARVVVKERETIVIPVSETLLVITSETYAATIAKVLDGSSAITAIAGAEVVVIDVDNPSATLKAGQIPPIPKSLKNAHATITPGDNDALDLFIEATSTSPEQAEKDADYLTEMIKDRTSVKVGPVRMQLFDGVAFEPQGSKVVADRQLTRDELERLIGFARLATN